MNSRNPTGPKDLEVSVERERGLDRLPLHQDLRSAVRVRDPGRCEALEYAVGEGLHLLGYVKQSQGGRRSDPTQGVRREAGPSFVEDEGRDFVDDVVGGILETVG